mgnify:CR=1 FL=1
MSLGLNAPFGAQCFPTVRHVLLDDDTSHVSMHLLVLSAFRRGGECGLVRVVHGLNAPFGAQCFPTRGQYPRRCRQLPSQCTFWCSVLSDNKGTS